MMIRIGIFAALLMLGGYSIVQAWPLISGPSITIDSPLPESRSLDAFITISGTAHHTESLYLNGGPLLIDENGRFEKTLVLAPGGAILSLTAADRFGRSATERRQILVP